MRFSNFAFGSLGDTLPSINLKTYTRIPVPASIKAYVAGQFSTANSAGRHTPGWSVQWPGGVAGSKAEVERYEQMIQAAINAGMAAAANFKPGDPTFKAANDMKQDLQFFDQYNQIKFQDLYDMLTMEAVQRYQNTYFGDYTSRRAFYSWLDKQGNEAMNEMMDQANLLMGDAVSMMSNAKLDFYTKKLVPIANKLSQSDQQRLQDVFIMQMDGDVTLDDLVAALMSVAPYLTYVDFSSVLVFAYPTILGSNMGAGVLNIQPESSLYMTPYYGRNVKAEIAEVTGQYNAVASRLGKWLDKSTPGYFQTYLQNWQNSYTYPDNPAYYSSTVDQKISSNFMQAITDGVMSVTPFLKDAVKGAPLAPKVEAPTDLVEKVKSTILESVLNSPSIDVNKMAESGNEIAQQAINAVQNAQNLPQISQGSQISKSSSISLLIIAGIGLLLLGKKE